jgi:serine/threonine protein kinase/WD40 repeat protein
MASPLQQVEKLFHEVLELAPEKRPAFLDTRCAGDTTLREAVEKLLLFDDGKTDTGTLFTSPLAQAAGQLRDESPTLAEEGGIPPSEPPPAVAGYELLEELGRGGMGVVYKARQISLNRLVALKMLLPGRAAAPERLARFRLEAEALACLQHPHIIAIYDIDSAAGRPYFSMEFVAGGSLAQLLDGRPQDIPSSAGLLETLARTMDVVHRHGIVHRDLKPANILLSPEPSNKTEINVPGAESKPSHGTLFPKISDFGLAKVQSAGSKLTQTGMVMGTLSYMAPEQARSAGQEVGPAADQYALGSILYEMLTGRPPFEAETPAESIEQLLNVEPLSPARLRPKVPRDLATICLKCLEKSPRQRYASTRELARDLRRFQAGEPIQARPVGIVGRLYRWCRRRPLVACLLMLSLILAMRVVALRINYAARLEDAFASAQAQAELERQLLVAANVAVARDKQEQQDAFLALLRFAQALKLDEGHGDHETELRTAIADTLRQCPLPDDFRVRKLHLLCMNLDAGGGWLVLAGANQQIQMCDAYTGQPAGPVLAMREPVHAGAVSRDGRWLVTLGETARFWDVSTGKPQELPCKGKDAIIRAFFHPERRILLTQHADAALRFWDLTTGPLQMPPPFTSAGIASVSDDGRWLFTIDDARHGQLWDVDKGQAVGRPISLGEKVSRCAVGPGGRLLALAGPANVLRLWDVSAATWSTPMRLGQRIEQVAFSPSGDRVLVVAGNQGTQIWRIPSSELISVLYPPAAIPAEVHFSPDGSLVIATDHTGAGRLWDAATGRPAAPPLRHGGSLATAVHRRDGKLVCISRSGTVATWSMPLKRSSRNQEVPESRPVDQLITLAEFLASSQLDEQQIRRDLSADELQSRWEAIKRIGGMP